MKVWVVYVYDWCEFQGVDSVYSSLESARARCEAIKADQERCEYGSIFESELDP